MKGTTSDSSTSCKTDTKRNNISYQERRKRSPILGVSVSWEHCQGNAVVSDAGEETWRNAEDEDGELVIETDASRKELNWEKDIYFRRQSCLSLDCKLLQNAMTNFRNRKGTDTLLLLDSWIDWEHEMDCMHFRSFVSPFFSHFTVQHSCQVTVFPCPFTGLKVHLSGKHQLPRSTKHAVKGGSCHRTSWRGCHSIILFFYFFPSKAPKVMTKTWPQT